MANRVAVFGGGVRGLSAAQELAKRGFEVEVFEAKSEWGGKGRSLSIVGTGKQDRKDLPGEHGFRFFPSFYKHLPDTMKRIPFGANPNGVFDNLVYASRMQIARAGKCAVIETSRFPQTLDDWLTALASLFTPLGIPAAETTFFVGPPASDTHHLSGAKAGRVRERRLVGLYRGEEQAGRIPALSGPGVDPLIGCHARRSVEPSHRRRRSAAAFAGPSHAAWL